MSTTVTRNWNLLLRNENNVTRVYYYGYDKNDLFINSYVDLSQSIIYSGYTDTYMLEQFILPALNAAISDINLTIPNTNNYLTGNSNNDSYYVGSLQNNDRFTSCKLMCISLSQTVTHTDVESVDYTNILTDINTNLSNLNTNISNKNNQSDIVDCLNNIFCYASSNNTFISSVKDVNVDSLSESYKYNMNINNLLYHFLNLFKNASSSKDNLTSSLSSRALNDISKKLCYLTPTQNSDNNSIFRILRIIALSLSKDSSVNLSNDSNIVSNAALKGISDKLANTNDLHTISQAIDLISTSIAQTPTTDTTNLEQGLTEIKESIDNKDNVLIVDGEQTFKFRDKDS